MAGIVYVALVLLGLIKGGIIFTIIFAVILALALFEFYRLTDRDTHSLSLNIFNSISGVVLFVLSSLTTYISNNHIIIFAVFILYLMLLLSASIFSKSENNLKKSIYSVFGHAYITLPFVILLHLNDVNIIISLAIFVLIWVNDTAAYLVGSLFGKNKLIERISPKKTIEGFVGGVAFTIIGGIIFAYTTCIHNFTFWIIFAGLVSVFGTIGDLFESLIKRSYKVKDSGKLIPGHGGILDRIDSLLVAIPVIYLYTTIMKLL